MSDEIKIVTKKTVVLLRSVGVEDTNSIWARQMWKDRETPTRISQDEHTVKQIMNSDVLQNDMYKMYDETQQIIFQNLHNELVRFRKKFILEYTASHQGTPPTYTLTPLMMLYFCFCLGFSCVCVSL